MIQSATEAMAKIRSDDASDVSEACCFLVRAYASSKSPAMLKALTSLLWDEDRCPLDLEKMIVPVLPEEAATKVAIGHPDVAIRAHVIRMMDRPRQVEQVLASKPKDPFLMGAALERGLQLGVVDSVEDSIQADVAMHLKAQLANQAGAPSREAEAAFDRLVQSRPSRDDLSFVRAFMRRVRWASPMASSIFRHWLKSKKVAKFKSDKDKREFEEASAEFVQLAGERLAEGLGGDALKGVLGEMDHPDAARFASGARKGLKKEDANDVDYIVALKSGDPIEVIRAIRADPVRRSREAIQMILRKDGAQASAIRELLSHVYYKVDQDALSRLWNDREDLRLPIMEAIGHKMPGRILADVATGDDAELALAAANALAKKRNVTLIPPHKRDIEI